MMIEPLYDFSLTAEQEARARTLHESSIILDMLFQGPVGTYSLPEGAEEELLRRADVVTLHCLLTDETRKLIDRERLALMKPTALLINCARGPIVDEAALIEALENGRLAGAGLDVTDPEPVAPDSPLFKLPNVIVTPHYAPTTVESATRVSKIAAENIKSRWAASSEQD